MDRKENIKQNNRLAHFLLLIVVSLMSCVSRKEIVYFQPGSTPASGQALKYTEPAIQTDDILSIRVSSLSKEASSFFNMNNEGEVKDDEGYLVDGNGSIEMPLIGQIKVSGLTTKSARDTLRKKLEKYLQNPAVTVRYKNFRVIVLGDVERPGVYTIPNEKINIIEAIGLAGDLTIYAKRNNIMVIRDSNGKKDYGSIDLNSRNVFESPYYYLRTNDVIYVEPGKGKTAQSDNFYRVVPVILSGFTILVVILTKFL